MSILDQAKSAFIRVCNERSLDPNQGIAVRPLLSREAIGDAEGDFAIKEGKEHVIEAKFGEGCGQAFTGVPRKWSGTLGELLSLELSDVGNRGVFVAAVNAVLRSVGLASGTMHCRDEDPANCGSKIAGQLENRFGFKRIGLIGLQPAILKALTSHFGPELVRVVDLNPDNIGCSKYDVEIWDGHADLPRLVKWSELGLATGSSIVNGSMDKILGCFENAEKPLVFFGNTISGAAALLGLDRLCPFGR